MSQVHCATEGCSGEATERFEHGGVGSTYCPACVAKIAALTPAGGGEVVAYRVVGPGLDEYLSAQQALRLQNKVPGFTYAPLYASPPAAPSKVVEAGGWKQRERYPDDLVGYYFAEGPGDLRIRTNDQALLKRILAALGEAP